MRWQLYVEQIMKKTKYLIFIFSKLAKIFQSATLMMIYYALFDGVFFFLGGEKKCIDARRRNSRH